MSLPGFDVLRADHRGDVTVIDDLERILRQTLLRDPNSVIDERIVQQQLATSAEIANKLLVELVSANTLEPVFFWICPTDGGTVREESSLTQFPDVVECDRCGHEHYFNTSDVEVHFLASTVLDQHLARDRSR